MTDVTVMFHGDPESKITISFTTGLVQTVLNQALTEYKIQSMPGQHCRFKHIPQGGLPPRILNNLEFIERVGILPGDTLEILWSGKKPQPVEIKDNQWIEMVRQCVDESLIKNIDDYVIDTSKKLGSGAFGEVNVGYAKSAPKVKLAFKRIYQTTDWNELKQFYREVRIMANVRFPSVMNLVGVILDDATPGSERAILIMPLMVGSMQDLIDGTNPACSVWRNDYTSKYIMLYGTARAMQELHHAGVVHRDLKPQNVLFDEHGYPLVTDFGASGISPGGVLMSILASVKACGTKSYSAPEVGTGRMSGKADVWSFGMMVWCILSGMDPGPGKDLYTCKGRKTPEEGTVSDEFLNEMKDASDALKKLVKDCLKQTNDHRPSFDEVVDQMETSECCQGINLDQFAAYKKRLAQWRDDLKMLDTDKTELKKLRVAMQNGDAGAAITIGEFYECGYDSGLVVDFTEAVNYYKKAAAMGHKERNVAMKHLARCYRSGIGVAKDEILAQVLEEQAESQF